jgi:hypothetical protein
MAAESGSLPGQSAREPIDEGVVRAVAWCRLGSGRTPRPWPTDEHFHQAEALGFLRHDPTWHATPEGEGVLIAAGLLDGSPAPELATIHVLWATCPRYPRPQFVAAWSDGLVECWVETYNEQREEAERFYRDFGDGDEGWTFWTTVEEMPLPAGAPVPEVDHAA